jgi:hypothetical protein
MQEEIKSETLNVTQKSMNTHWTIAAIGVALMFVHTINIASFEQKKRTND